MRWVTINECDGPDHDNAVETSDDGQWTITREQVDGDDRFSWVIRSADHEVCEDFQNRREARREAELRAPVDRRAMRFAELHVLATPAVQETFAWVELVVEQAVRFAGIAPGIYLDENGRVEARWIVSQAPGAPHAHRQRDLR